MSKILSVAIPSYNSEGYLKKCVESLLPGGEDVEILIVNDGSTDSTPAIADELARQYPTIVKVIHKENGGHGSAVNAGIDHATGIYYKVVDSDDWVKESAYLAILEKLKEFSALDTQIDMMISNYVYEKEGEKRKKVMRYPFELPQHRVFGWDEVKRFHKWHYLLMHSVIFRTQLLRECGLRLPEHTFYVDNIYVYEPLVYVEKMYYMDVNFYRYYIGRAGQSVGEKTMIARIDQQIRVNKIMVDYFVEHKNEIQNNRKLCQYMRNYLEIITTISSVMLILSDTKENLDKKKELWEYIKSKDRLLFLRMRTGILGGTMNLPGRGGRKISKESYRLCQKFFKFN